MKAEHPLTKADERRLMSEFDRERHEAELDLPADQRHEDPEWVQAFWLARRVMQ